MELDEGEKIWLLPRERPSGSTHHRARRAVLVLAAAASASAAGAALLVSSAAKVALVSSGGSSGPPLPLSAPSAAAGAGGAHRPAARQAELRRTELIAMGERAVGRLLWRLEKGVEPRESARRGAPGLRVARAPQLAAAADDVEIGGRHFVRSQMLSAIDAFFESDQNKLLVAQAIEEEALEAENGGQGEGTDVMAADALERLEAGDTEFENEWANAGEKVTSDASASRATHATYKFMIERDLGHAREEFNEAKAAADAEQAKLQQEQAGLAAVERALADAQKAAEDAAASATGADADVASAEAAQAALDAQAESDAQLAAGCPELAAALETAGTAGQTFQDSLELVADATGQYGQTSETTVEDVSAIGTAAEDVSATDATVATARANCLAQMGSPADDTLPVGTFALSVEQANAAKAAAEAAKQEADKAVSEKEADKAAAEAAVAAQQALFDEKKAIADAKQAIMDKLLEAHKALACNPKKLANEEPYTIEMQEAGACEYPASESRVQLAIDQAEKAAEEARNRAEIDGLMSDKAWWQKALEELGDARPAIDKAQAAWDEAKAMKEAETAA